MDYVHKPMPRHQHETQSLTVGPVQPALYAQLEVHPVKTIQDNARIQGERQHLQQMSVLYGSHLPMRFVIERNILAGNRRLGGYGSSMFGLNMHMDRYDELDFSDILSDPYQSPITDKEGVHAQAEKEFGIRA
ncbi:hypothetical protein FGO68_gene70 [Halteria grandinella]|uniref:Proteasome maturation factor UMP1 n=1 Tax=Halteria grandinella TaxID=5974 RepID=A0A8J8SYH6_HALGN|nr:hypothetical protein FGO68_gene70 [Halteria grandinella]